MLSNGAAYVLDWGLGVTDRFTETGIPFSAVRSIFITREYRHLHGAYAGRPFAG
jgi:hypothetical protein